MIILELCTLALVYHFLGLGVAAAILGGSLIMGVVVELWQ